MYNNIDYHNSMRRIYVHIGSEKTGSTTIQSSLEVNRLKLQEQKLIYPVIQDKYKSLLSLPFDQEKNHNDILGGRSIKKISEFIKENLRKEFKSNELNYIISSELLHSRLRTIESLINLREFLERYFDNICIICYQRDPWEKAVSLLSESIKIGAGQLSGEVMFSEYYYHACSIKRTPNMWKQVFSEHSFILLEDVTKNESLINHFYSQIGIDSRKFEQIEKKNRSLSIKEARFLSFVYTIIINRKEKDHIVTGRNLNTIKRKIVYNMYMIYKWMTKRHDKQNSTIQNYFSQEQKQMWLREQQIYERSKLNGEDT